MGLATDTAQARSAEPAYREMVDRVFAAAQSPYPERMPRAEYEMSKRLLQIELLKMQAWVKDTNQRVAILFEGRARKPDPLLVGPASEVYEKEERELARG